MLLVIKEKIIMYSKFFLVFKILKSKLIAMTDEQIIDSSDPQQNNKTNSSSSYLDNLNLNENDDTDVDAEEIPYNRKRGFNKIYEEFKTYQIRTQFQTPELPRKEKFLVMMKHKLKDLEHKHKVQNIVLNATLQ